jgi:OOP family OmpA-OmpF porin
MFRIAIPIFVLALSLTGRAGAQASLENGGGDLHMFRPAVDSKGLFTLDGTDILGHTDFSFGLVLDAGFGLVPFEGFTNSDATNAESAERRSHLVDQLSTGTFHFNFGLFNSLVVGVQVPVHIASGPNVVVPGVYNSAGAGGLDYQGLGNITVHGKVRITRVERDGVGLAALLHVELPTGEPSSFAGDGFALWPTHALELRPVREVRVAMNLGYRLSFDESAVVPVGGRTMPRNMNATGAELVEPGTEIEYGHLVTAGIGASFRVADPLDLVLEVYATQSVNDFGEIEGLSAEAIGGLKVFVERNSYLFIGAGAGIPTDGFQSADFRGTVGFIFEPSIGDRDGDGYKDDDDQCPDEPEDFDNFGDEDGCPDPDNDRDGILDIDDECELVPEDRDGDADDDGCPEGGEGDRDGDGILDEADACPDDPEDRDGFRDEDGCPDPDNDEDRMLDEDDLCPNDPEDYDEFEDGDGCPDPDNDQDRILDVDDECPNDPEVYNELDDHDGCPDRNVLEVTEEGITLFEDIHFATDSAVILDDSFPLLDVIAATLSSHSNLELVEIQGHADERASDAYNIALTRDRAASVVEALVQRGVMRARLRSAGYGERCPADPRHNERAWEANRRVEIKIIEQEGLPRAREEIITCPAGRELMPE